MGKEYYTRPRDTFPTRLRRTTEQTRPDGSATEAKASAIDPSGLFLNEETSVSDYSEFMPQFPPPQRKLLGERSPTLSTSENTSHFVVFVPKHYMFLPLLHDVAIMSPFEYYPCIVVLLGGMVMTNGTKDSVGDWLKWLFAAAIIASFSFPIRFAFSPETYAKLSGTQEFMLFCLEVVGIAYFVVRPFAKSRVQDRR